MKSKDLILVLDDDPSMRSSLEQLLTAQGHNSRSFAVSKDLFQWELTDAPTCLILDQHLEGDLSGLEVHAELVNMGWYIPTIFLTAHDDARLAVNALRSGAVGFLAKPYDPQELMKEVGDALEHARSLAAEREKRRDLEERIATLTDRERTIVVLASTGMLNKQIADELNLALVTIKVHRSNAMQKLGAKNAAELAHLATLAGLTLPS